MATISSVESLQRKLEGSLASKMSEFEERLKAASTPTNPTVIQLRDEFHIFKEVVSSMLNLLQQQIQNCVQNIDAINMHKRRKALVFNGVEESSKEDLEQKILLLLHTKMGLTEFNNSSLKHCFRLGVQDSKRTRPIVVYFHDYHEKSTIWKTKAKLKGSSVSMGEFLTRMRQSVYKAARIHFGMKNVWSLDGTIYIKHPEGRAKVITEEDLDALITKFPKTTTAASTSAIIPGSSEVKKVAQAPRVTTPKAGQSEKLRRQQVSLMALEDDTKRTRRIATKK